MHCGLGTSSCYYVVLLALGSVYRGRAPPRTASSSVCLKDLDLSSTMLYYVPLQGKTCLEAWNQVNPLRLPDDAKVGVSWALSYGRSTVHGAGHPRRRPMRCDPSGWASFVDPSGASVCHVFIPEMHRNTSSSIFKACFKACFLHVF